MPRLRGCLSAPLASVQRLLWTAHVLRALASRLLSLLWSGRPHRWAIMLARLCLFGTLTSIGWALLLPLYFLDSTVLRGLPYGPHRRNEMDVYLPHPAVAWPGPRGRPVVVLFPGGAWIVGYKLWLLPLARVLAAAGCVVVTLDYRNAPQTCLPGMVADADVALRAVSAHPAVRAAAAAPPASKPSKVGSDVQHDLLSTNGNDSEAPPPLRLYVLGQSAGAHLALCAILDAAYEESQQQARTGGSEGAEANQGQPSSLDMEVGGEPVAARESSRPAALAPLPIPHASMLTLAPVATTIRRRSMSMDFSAYQTDGAQYDFDATTRASCGSASASTSGGSGKRGKRPRLPSLATLPASPLVHTAAETAVGEAAEPLLLPAASSAAPSPARPAFPPVARYFGVSGPYHLPFILSSMAAKGGFSAPFMASLLGEGNAAEALSPVHRLAATAMTNTERAADDAALKAAGLRVYHKAGGTVAGTPARKLAPLRLPPITLVHGDADLTVPLHVSVEPLVAALGRLPAPPPVDIVVLPGGTHTSCILEHAMAGEEGLMVAVDGQGASTSAAASSFSALVAGVLAGIVADGRPAAAAAAAPGVATASEDAESRLVRWLGALTAVSVQVVAGETSSDDPDQWGAPGAPPHLRLQWPRLVPSWVLALAEWVNPF